MASQDSEQSSAGCWQLAFWYLIFPISWVYGTNNAADFGQWIAGYLGFAITVILAVVAFALFVAPGCGGKFLGLITLALCLALGIVTTGYVKTHDIGSEFQSIQQWVGTFGAGTPEATAEASAEPQSESTESFTEAPRSESTSVSIAPTAESTESPASSQESATDLPIAPTEAASSASNTSPDAESTQSLVLPLDDSFVETGGESILNFLGPAGADRSSAQPLSPTIEIGREAFLFITLAQFAMAFILNRSQKRQKMRYFILTPILNVLFSFTKLGEWIYMLVNWLFSLGYFGRFIAVCIGLLSGSWGYGNISALIIAGYLYQDMEMMLFCVTPSIIGGMIFLFYYAWVRRGRTEIDFLDNNIPRR